MKNQGIYVSLDIGTTSIKVTVAEYVRGQLNIIGVGNEKSEGLSRGVIVDIDETVESIKKAVKQAEQKSNIAITDVVVGIPSNQIAIEPCHGMIAVSSENNEITDVDVYNVISAAKVRSVAPEREIISVIPEEFIVDGFDGIKDPRGMIGVRLELYASMITGPKTIVHNIKRCVSRAGLNIEEMVIQPLAISQVAMTKGEREFGTILIDMGGGQTSASVIHDDQLKFSYVDQEGGDLVSKDISVVLNTSFDNAERIKREYGYAISEHTSSEEFFPVETIGKKDPVKVDEHYLSEIIEARLVQTFENIKRALDRVEALQLPGGIVMTGGASSMEGVVELAEEIFGVNIRTYIPEQIGMRNPVFATSMGLIEYSASLDDVDRIALQGKLAMGRSKEAQQVVRPASQPTYHSSIKHVEKEVSEVAEAVEEHIEEGAETLWDKIKNFIKMFID
ncbi:cell division protein FtsA [Granulicatella balaenopterae]|uniref:Cell division protein FtsA n=1 Tax=Granulicatella balaenopterae TaxID=137733 RepID=A0A1H9ICD6_9LACT|nr:cell division protein FtsA [Granulicatella balaenopterae]SEQ72214.1 cell division protein FtsA [Granulicatella balaenopterae]